MVTFSNRYDIEHWLTGKPREVAVVIAARAALRVAPLLGIELRQQRYSAVEFGRYLLLPVFRGLAAPWIAVASTKHSAEIDFSAAYAAAAAVAKERIAAAAADAANAAAAAAAAADAANAAYAADDAADDAANAAASAVTANDAAAAAATIYEAVSVDATELGGERLGRHGGLRPAELANQALWPIGIPSWAAEEWTQLKSALLAENKDWWVWTDWYEARLAGGPITQDLELARVTIAPDNWRGGPRTVNAEIAQLIAKHHPMPSEGTSDKLLPPLDSVPVQIPQALVFGGDENKPIDLIDPPGEGINDTPDQRQGHSDIREKAGLLEAACGASNRLAVVKGRAVRLVGAMGSALLELQVRAFWAQMNSLRRRVEADERVRQSPDPDDPPLPEEVAGLLYDLVDALNVFAAHEPKLAALDELKRDPAERAANAATIAAAQRLAESSASAPQAVKSEAADSLVEATGNASGNTPAADRDKEFSVKSARNLALEMIRRSYKALLKEPGVMAKGARDGAYRFFGSAAAAYGSAMLIKANEAAVRTLIDTLGGSQTLHKIVDLIVKALS